MRVVAACLVIGLAAGGFLAGCGTGGHPASTSTRASRSTPSPSSTGPNGSGTTTIPTPPPTGAAASPAAVRVIKGWSDALRHGDVRRAARYFALPSEMINGTGSGGQVSVIRILTPQQAVVANETLPCGAAFLSADRRGRFVNALFRLTGRPGPGGGPCGAGPGGGAPGVTARTNFVIAGGRIVEWVRAPDEPGDNRGSGAPAPSPPNPTTSGPVA